MSSFFLLFTSRQLSNNFLFLRSKSFCFVLISSSFWLYSRFSLCCAYNQLRSCNSYLDNPSQQLISSFHSLSSVNQKRLQRIFFYFFSTSSRDFFLSVNEVFWSINCSRCLISSASFLWLSSLLSPSEGHISNNQNGNFLLTRHVYS